MDDPIRKTRQAWNEPGHAHFVTYSCYRRWPLLTKDRARGWVIDALAATRAELDVALWAYVIMPEHVHILLRPRRRSYDRGHILAALKRRVAQNAKAHLAATGRADCLARLSVRYPSRQVFRFWQPGGGYDHNIFRERTVPAVIDYIHANPVRRELVATPTDWFWSSARFWEGWANVPLELDHPDGCPRGRKRGIMNHAAEISVVHERTLTTVRRAWRPHWV